jgi:septal ring factor EnvC (AmiA/AmiB activator)
VSRAWWVPLVPIVFWVMVLAAQNGSQADQIEQLKTDRATVQQQIASEQARTRQLEATLEQMLANQAATSASVTTIPTCTLHDIYEQTAGC